MFNLVGSPLIQDCHSRLPAGLYGGKSFSYRVPRRKSLQLVFCSSSSAAFLSQFQGGFAKDGQRPRSDVEPTRKITRGRSFQKSRVASLSSSFPKAESGGVSNNGVAKNPQNGLLNRLPVEASAKGKWQKNHDSSLSGDEPLPLPMTWPDSEPAPQEAIDKMLSCNPEQETCKDVVYQWTGDCKSCQGTGLVSFYRKRREVISKCITCLGIGSVHKITSRADIQDMDGTNESSNGSARTNGRA